MRWTCGQTNHFVWDPTPGFRKATAYLQSCCPAAHGGVGLIDPVLEVTAIHAHRLVSALCSKEDGAWRHLLWDAILHAVPHGRCHLALRTKWRKKDLRGGLAADILLAFSSLDITDLPVTDVGVLSCAAARASRGARPARLRRPRAGPA